MMVMMTTMAMHPALYISPPPPPSPIVQSDLETCHTGNKGDTAGPGAYDPTDSIYSHRGYSHFHKSRGRGELFDISSTPGPDAYQAAHSYAKSSAKGGSSPNSQRC